MYLSPSRPTVLIRARVGAWSGSRALGSAGKRSRAAKSLSTRSQTRIVFLRGSSGSRTFSIAPTLTPSSCTGLPGLSPETEPNSTK
jgi:hypothetical protein